MKKHFIFILVLFSWNCFSQKNKLFDYYLTQGTKHHDNRKLDSCNYFITKLDSILSNNLKDSTSFYKTEILKASFLLRKNKRDEALNKLLKTSVYFKKHNDSAHIGITQHKIGIANYYLNRRSVALQYFTKALRYKKYLSKKTITRINQGFGSIYLEFGILQKNDSLKKASIPYFKKAIAIYKKENWLLDQTLATSLLAESYNQLKKHTTAITLINQAIALAKKDKNKNQLGFALVKKTSFLTNTKRYNQALKNIKEAKNIFKSLQDYPMYLYALNEEKKALIGLKKFKEATVIGDSIYQVSIKSYNLRFTDKVAEMDAKYKTTEKEKEIALQKEKILENELKIKNRNIYAILLASALLFLGIISAGYYYRSNFKRKQLEKEITLKDALAKIKTQNRLQEQRLHISRDLHDNIGSQLTFIISSIDNLKYISNDLNNTIKNKLTNISEFTATTIHQLRDTIWAMNKNEISINDFSMRLLSFIEKAKEAVPYINFKHENNIPLHTSFTSMEGINLFRVVQEAINNAIKYAEADTIELKAKLKNQSLQLHIKDNGKGFDINSVTLGSGLSNMEKRMSSINGSVFINSEKNKGTTISLELPFTNNK